MEELRVGMTIKFGRYAGEDIEFEILEINAGKALIVSKKIIECKIYISDKEPLVEYNNDHCGICELRYWLNNEFYNTAFNEEEKLRIQQYITEWDDFGLRHWLNNDLNSPEFNNVDKTKIEEFATYNKVFLLSPDEYCEYYPIEEKGIKVLTQHASNTLVKYKEQNECDYFCNEYEPGQPWLYWCRSEYDAYHPIACTCIWNNGKQTQNLAKNMGGIVPALMIKI